jgi:ubiquinone/menaquinone biosynthesis C-methylase UbiE
MKREEPDPAAGRDPRIAYFDALAPRWDAQGPSAEDQSRHLQEHACLLGLSPGQGWLEVGCGTGKATGWLAGKVAPGTVTAVDFSPQMIERASRKGIHAEFRCADACRDDLGERLYDAVLCFHCFPHFRDQAAALRNLSRALRPEGRLIVMHMRGSQQINRFHAGIDGPVRGDRLPQGRAWDFLIGQAGMQRGRLIDRQDLFFLEATKAAT